MTAAEDSAGRRQAILLLERAAQDANAPMDGLVQLVALYRLEDRLDEALIAGLNAVERYARLPGPFFALGMVHVERAEFDQAIGCFLRALARNPDFPAAHLELGHILLLRGEFAAGWREYEWRFRLEATRNLLPKFPAPAWNGMRLPAGRILLIGDQGYGDTIQFARFMPAVAERCAEILGGCSPELLPVIAPIAGPARCYTRWEELPPFDAFAPLSSLPYLLGIDLASIPAPIPYLKPDSSSVERWAMRLGSSNQAALRVGIAWAGRPTHPNDRLRSVRWWDFEPLAQIQGVSLYSLQKNISALDQPAVDQPNFGIGGVTDLAAELTDFGAAAAAIANLDLVITVDTALAHLAGALGKPVWILLPLVPDWRWMLDREDSPWYPTARLFRQKIRGAWAPVITEVAAELRAVAEGDRRRLMPVPGVKASR